MQYENFSHKKAGEVIQRSLQKEVEKAICDTLVKSPVSTTRIRNSILENLKNCGWSDEVRIDPVSKIDITSIKSEVGLCVQTGNMSRIYADALKLQTLFAQKNIKGGIYIVPVRSFAKKIGQNIANYERFVRELEIFSKTLTMPLLVYGIEG